MDDSVIVKCEECGSEALIYARDSRSLERANAALPLSWRIWREQNGDLKYLCPNHNSDTHFKRYAGDYALEG